MTKVTTTKSAFYWAANGLLAFRVLSGGAAQLAQRAGNAEGMARLEYPLYFMTILGFWKVLGGIVPVVSSTRRPPSRTLPIHS